MWETEGIDTQFLWGVLGEGDQLEDLGVDGRIILRWIFRKWDWGTNWIDPTHDRDRWRALVNTVMSHLVP